MASPITTHILNTASGRPAAGVRVILSRFEQGEWVEVGDGVTDDDGRNKSLMAAGQLTAGRYRIFFDIGTYFSNTGKDSFYPEAAIVFEVVATDEHYHVPLLLSPFGYSTYRGS
ncbi:MAG: hydroxyisourate hydrolase [Bradymonadia bacterium]